MNKNVLILSGPTHEYIDPVRFIGNASSGRMGKALANEAVQQGYTVQFITGPVATANLPDLGRAGQVYPVTSAADMLVQATLLFQSADAVIFAAAVADYAPEKQSAEKITKSEKDLVLHLRATPDIAKTLCKTKRTNQTTIGFALQTSNGAANARRKLTDKNLDGIVLNTPATLGAETGLFSFISASSTELQNWGSIKKKDCAKRIFQQLEIFIGEK